MVLMMLNNDDTRVEQYSNYTMSNIPNNVMINCSKCSRLFFIPQKIGRDKLKLKLPLLCIRCRNEETK